MLHTLLNTRFECAFQLPTQKPSLTQAQAWPFYEIQFVYYCGQPERCQSDTASIWCHANGWECIQEVLHGVNWCTHDWQWTADHWQTNHLQNEIWYNQAKFADWLANKKIFLESNSLSVKKTATIGYLAKLHPDLTSCTHLKPFLLEELLDIIIDPELACELDPSQKTAQLEAMANGNMFIPQVPLFKLYKTHISYGRDKMRVKTDIFRIKCSIDKAWLLKEFFAQLSNPMELDTRIGTFVPTRAVHLLGLEMYTNLTCDHNSFLQSIATVPVGNFQHNTLDIPFSCDSSNNIEQTTINNLILDQLWCLNVERTTTPNKVLIVTTKGQLAAACEWINNSLPALYTQHVDDKIDVTTLKHLTPHHLDKPNLTLALWTYAEKLKQCTNYSTSTQPMSQFNQPPQACNTKHPKLTFKPAATPTSPIK